MKSKLKEEMLYIPLKKHFETMGFDVKSEIGHMDILCLKDDLMVAVEMKLTLNLEVILQATERQPYVDLTYIAILKDYQRLTSRRFKMTCDLLKRLKLGLLLVTIKEETSFVEELIAPESFRIDHRTKKTEAKKKALLKEFKQRKGDYNLGGSSRKKLITAYREKAIHIGVLLDIYGVLSIKELREMGTDKDKTGAILRDNYYGWFEKVSRGHYRLTKDGKKGLEVYKELSEYYYKSSGKIE